MRTTTGWSTNGVGRRTVRRWAIAARSIEGEERGRRRGKVGGDVESEGDSGGGPATGKAFDLSLTTGPSSPWSDQFTSRILDTCGVLRRLHWRKGQEKVLVRLLLQSSRVLLEIILPVIWVSVRGALWRAIHRVVEGGRRSGRDIRRERVEEREKGRRRNPTGGHRRTKLPKQAAKGVEQ